MSLENIRESLPEYTKDLKLNLSTVMTQIELTPKQAWGTALTCAIVCKNPSIIDAVEADAKLHLTEEEVVAAKTAASLMAMTNIYYRFNHLANDSEFAKMPARLRMNALRSHGTDQINFELWCTAASSITGCEMCVTSHCNQLKEHGVSRETILAAIRIAAVINSASCVVV